MSDLWDKLITEARSVSLTKEEKSAILQSVRERMDSPVSEPVIMTQEVKTPYFSQFSFNFTWHEKRFVPIAVILIVVVFGGTAFAANGALPGDVLYSMKVNVNEKVESWGALSPNASARFEAVKAERRLKEIEKITIQKKKISPEVKAQVKENLDKNIQKVKEITAEIAANGDVEDAASVKAELESKLEAHSVVLGKLSTNEDLEKITEVSDEGKADIRDINDLVDAHIDDLKIESEGSEEKPVDTEAVDEKDLKTEDKVKSEEDKKAEESADLEVDSDVLDESGTTMADIASQTDEESVESTDGEEKVLSGDMNKDEQPEKEQEQRQKDKKEDQKKTKKELKNKSDKAIDNPKVQAEVKSILKELDLPTED